MGLVLFRHGVPPARPDACWRWLAGDVVGAPGARTAVLRTVAAAPATGCVLEAWIGMRGLRGDPMPGVRRRRLDRCLQERNSAPARSTDGTAQGSHRAVGAWLSAFCASRPADRVPAGNAALVGLLAEGGRHRRDGPTHAARLDDGKRETCVASPGVAGPVGCGTCVAIDRSNAPAAVLDRRGAARRRGALTPRAVCSPQTVGKCAGDWVPFGRGPDQAGD